MSNPAMNRLVANFTCESSGDKRVRLMDFRDLHASFKRQKTAIFGISRGSIASHETFKAKQSFPFDLLSDPDVKDCRKFDVIREKMLYGRKFMGVERRKLKVKGHAANVLEAVKVLGI